jgi:hypothetical protein
MQWQQIGKRCSQYLQNAMRHWLLFAGGEMSNSRWQLERIVDSVCDRHGVARNTAELEIYKGLLRLTAERPARQP